jgi:hypothetical protein
MALLQGSRVQAGGHGAGGARRRRLWQLGHLVAVLAAIVLAITMWATPTIANAAGTSPGRLTHVQGAANKRVPDSPQAATVKKWRIISEKLVRSWNNPPDWTTVCNYQIESGCDVTVSFTSENTLTGTLEVTIGALIKWFEATIGYSLSKGIGHSFTYGSSWEFSNLAKTKFIGYGGFVQDHFKYKIIQQLWYCVYDGSKKECELPNWERWGPWKNPKTGKYVESTIYVTDNQIYSGAKYRCKHPNKKKPYTPCAPGKG